MTALEAAEEYKKGNVSGFASFLKDCSKMDAIRVFIYTANCHFDHDAFSTIEYLLKWSDR
jgi:thymidine kinase